MTAHLELPNRGGLKGPDGKLYCPDCLKKDWDRDPTEGQD